MSGELAERFIVPPLTVLRQGAGYWRKRREYWVKEKHCNAILGRPEYALSGNDLKKDYVSAGTGYKAVSVECSIFDPVLTEICYRWFCPEQGEVLDPFAGGAVRGIVAESLGLSYTGVDLSQDQIDANIQNCNILGYINPTYICGDSSRLGNMLGDKLFDFVFSCPPYYNLEVYSEDERDLSNMSFDEFNEAYQSIIKQCSERLRNDRFAIFVVGNVRDKEGFYRDLVSETKQAFSKAGMRLYNEMVLVENIGTAAMKCARVFNSNRKITKVHQNVLVFYKGDPKKIKPIFGEFRL